MTDAFADRLAQAVTSRQSALVVGLDPVLERLPEEVRALGRAASDDPREQAARAIEAFDAAVIEAVAPFACAVKPQIAFYEQWGPAGLAAFERALAAARAAGLLVIADVKRGDIGSTAAAYARAHLAPSPDRTPADAATVNPYLGTDSLTPFLEQVDQAGAGLFVLVRTSNPSASELQDLPVNGRPLHEHVADLVVRWGEERVGRCGYSSVGAVVGATAPRELARLRACMPRAWLLLPGVGAQGATADDVASAFDERGLGAVINSSRGILYAFSDPARDDWRPPIAAAARRLRDELARAAGLTASRSDA
jgi:orotidine-5'-phosphate decarboxylase